jgi:hypothetical protein
MSSVSARGHAATRVLTLAVTASLVGCGGAGGKPAAPASVEPADCTESNITLLYEGRRYRLTSTCYDYDELKLAQGELLYGSDKGTPDMHLWACGDGVMVSLFGNATALPGTIERPIVKIMMPGDPNERPSVSAAIRVASFGAPGDMIAGSFDAVLSPKLNESAVPVHGAMCVRRRPDRNRP